MPFKKFFPNFHFSFSFHLFFRFWNKNFIFFMDYFYLFWYYYFLYCFLSLAKKKKTKNIFFKWNRVVLFYFKLTIYLTWKITEEYFNIFQTRMKYFVLEFSFHQFLRSIAIYNDCEHLQNPPHFLSFFSLSFF